MIKCNLNVGILRLRSNVETFEIFLHKRDLDTTHQFRGYDFWSYSKMFFYLSEIHLILFGIYLFIKCNLNAGTRRFRSIIETFEIFLHK